MFKTLRKALAQLAGKPAELVHPPAFPAPVAAGLVVQLPEDLTLAQLRDSFPSDRFRLVYKPGGVIVIQRIVRESLNARLINAGTAVIVRRAALPASV